MKNARLLALTQRLVDIRDFWRHTLPGIPPPDPYWVRKWCECSNEAIVDGVRSTAWKFGKAANSMPEQAHRYAYKAIFSSQEKINALEVTSGANAFIDTLVV